MKLESEALQSLVDAYREEHTLEPAERDVLERRLWALQKRTRGRSAWRWALVGALAAAAALLLVVQMRDRASEQADARTPVEASDRAADSIPGTAVSPQTRSSVPLTEPPQPNPPPDPQPNPRPPPDMQTPPRPSFPSRPRRPDVAPEPAAPAAEETSVDALELIASAQARLRAGRPSEALELLAEHGRRFPTASTQEEGSALRVLALCALGRSAEGRGARTVFLKDYPASAYRERVAAACKVESKP